MYTEADNADIFVHTNQSIEEIATSISTEGRVMALAVWRLGQ